MTLTEPTVQGFHAYPGESCGLVRLECQLEGISHFHGMIGGSPEMTAVFGRIRRVAPHFRTVLITGASGTGKELVAQALHQLSPAASHRFVACNCSAIVETLFESELFGSAKGAFTGAFQDRVGLFEYANGGTLLLDEIGEMPLATQAKLLRVLQNQEVQRVGSSETRKISVRVIAATNRNLLQLIARKQFREDLYYRLAMMEIRLPNLVDRKSDLPLLERWLLDKYSAQYGRRVLGFSRNAQALLDRHSWPGNIRELENVISHACMLAEGEVVEVDDLPDYLREPAPASTPTSADLLLPLAEVERQHAQLVLDRLGGNKVQAAHVLGISRATLYRILRDAVADDEETVRPYDREPDIASIQ